MGAFGVLAGLLLASGVSALTQTFWRFIISGVIYFGTATAFLRKEVVPSRGQVPYVLTAGAIMLLLSLTYIGAVGAGTPVPVVAFLLETSTLFIILLSAVFLRESPTRRKIIAASVGVVAIILLSRIWEVGSLGNAWGDSLAILNACLFAVLTVFNRRFVQRVNPQLVTTWMFLGAAIWSFVPFASGYVSVDLDAYQFGLVILMALIPTFASYSLLNWGMRRVNASTTAILLYVTPVTTALLSYPLLGEVLDPPEALGAALVLASIMILWEPHPRGTNPIR
jgi:drug/metabolite transporter (DMT)-like permease